MAVPERPSRNVAQGGNSAAPERFYVPIIGNSAETRFSPLSAGWIAQTGNGWDAAFDTLAAGVDVILSADRTHGGLCDWIEAQAPRPVDLAIDGAAALKAAVIPIVLHYANADPLA
jgi:hypothetical protein